MKIRDIEIKNSVIMAPMAGITNMAFRKIVKEFGAGLVYSEMVSDKAICYGNQKTIEMLQVDEGEHPVSIQLFGGEVESMVQAAKFIDEHSNCDIIDINCGCPVNKVLKANAGSKLLQNPQLIYDISILNQRSFTLEYVMFNVDDINREDYIAKVLSQDLSHLQKEVRELEAYRVKFKQVNDERHYYKRELEKMVVAYNSVTHSRRWKIPTAIINFFRRK